jgi:hypothetical protein
MVPHPKLKEGNGRMLLLVCPKLVYLMSWSVIWWSCDCPIAEIWSETESKHSYSVGIGEKTVTHAILVFVNSNSQRDWKIWAQVCFRSQTMNFTAGLWPAHLKPQMKDYLNMGTSVREAEGETS